MQRHWWRRWQADSHRRVWEPQQLCTNDKSRPTFAKTPVTNGRISLMIVWIQGNQCM